LVNVTNFCLLFGGYKCEGIAIRAELGFQLRLYISGVIEVG